MLTEEQKNRVNCFILSIVEQIETFKCTSLEREYLLEALEEAIPECFENDDFELIDDDDFDDDEFEDDSDLFEEDEFEDEEQDEEDLVEDEEDTGEFESPFSGEQN